MAGPLLVTTGSEGLQPLGSAAQRSFELVSGTVRARLGADHAALFADPVASDHGDRIDWYAPVRGTARPLADLPEPQAMALRDRLGRLVGDIRADAGTLATTGRPEDQRLAEALLNALEIPGEAMIWAVQGAAGDPQPVLVHWAWIRAERHPVRGVLTAMVPRRGPPVADPGMVTAGRGAGAWWALIAGGWVLLALLLGGILWLHLAPCGLNPLGPDRCPGVTAATPAVMTEDRVIADDIAGLERALALAARSCQPVIPVQPAILRPGDLPAPTQIPQR
jgi:hypothetical protein